jgi:hypothetical protein
MEPDELRLTRADFGDQEGWLRFCHQGGLDPWEEQESPDWRPVLGDGFYALLTRAKFGYSAETYTYTLRWPGGGPSDFLSYDELMRGHRAAEFANAMGWVLNALITVTWPTVGVSADLEVELVQRRFLAALDGWCRSKSLPSAWVWVLERGSLRGLHTHILAHLHPRRRIEFQIWCAKTIQGLTGYPLQDTDDSRTLDVQCMVELGTARQWRAFRYLFKGVDPRLGWIEPGALSTRWLANVAGLTPKAQGPIRATRSGVARGLELTAQATWLATHPSPPYSNLAAAVGPGDLYTDACLHWHFRQLSDGTWRP